MAVALYRKYRPRTFAEVIGQEHVTEPLSHALRSGRLHHAYLFSGPRGCGKTSSARILARSLNCAHGPTPEPCGECDSCRALAVDGPGSVDVIEIDAASHGGVDDARDLRERAVFTPVAGRFKIYVIDEAHMVSSAGFNALLKLVEEPPEYVTFVFATTEPEKVLPTIKSRTHHYPFRLVPPGVLRPYLEQLCAAEEVTVAPAVFPLVVRAGGGSVRDSLSVLDQLISGAGAAGVSYERAVALLGVTDAALLDDVCDALAAGDGAAAFAAVDRVAEAGHDPRRFAADLLERFRDLIVLQQVPDAVDKGLLDAPADQLAHMSTQAAQLGLATLSRCAEIVHTGLVEMRGTTSPRLLLELICARMLLPGADDSTPALLHRLERLERRLGAGGGEPAPAAPPAASPGPLGAAASPAPTESAGRVTDPGEQPTDPPAPPVPAAPAPAAPAPAELASAPPASAPPASAPPASAPPAGTGAAQPAPGGSSGVVDATAMRRVWDEIVATVGRGSKRAAAVAREAAVRDVEGDTIVLHFQHSVHASMLSSSPQPVLEAVRQVLGGSWKLRCEAGEGSPRAAEPQPGAGRSAGQSPSGAGASAAGAAGGSQGGAARHPAGVPAAAATGGEPDWPEPARPGGASPEMPASPPPEPPPAAGAAAPVGSDEEVDVEGDARTTAGNSEQQALALLRETLGAEKIGEVAP